MIRIGDDRGLTLVELLVSLVVLGIISTAAINLHLYQQRIFAKEEALTDMRSNTRQVLDIMTKDLRMAGYNPKEASAFNIAILDASEDRVTMAMDLDGNGCWSVPDSLGEHRGFRFVGDSALYRFRFTDSVNVVNNLIANDICYLEFQYLDSCGTAIATPVVGPKLNDIVAVNITIVGVTEREFSNHHEQGTYGDGTPYDDRHYRYWLTRTVELRNN